MEKIVDSISETLLLVASLVIFIFLVKSILPRITLRVNYSYEKWLGRGIKKFRYPEGRAVVYEPHPAFRKYINKYVLFTSDGYKYLKCKLDAGVKTLDYGVIMFNSNNKMIDVIEVKERVGDLSESGRLSLHGDTSYVVIDLERVNGKEIGNRVSCSYSRIGVFAYYAALILLCFLQMLLCAYVTENFLFTFFEITVEMTEKVGTFLIFAVLAATLGTAVLLVRSSKRGIGVDGNGKK